MSGSDSVTWSEYSRDYSEGTQRVWSASSLRHLVNYWALSPRSVQTQQSTAPHNTVYLVNHFSVAIIFRHDPVSWGAPSLLGKERLEKLCRNNGRHRRKAILWSLVLDNRDDLCPNIEVQNGSYSPSLWTFHIVILRSLLHSFPFWSNLVLIFVPYFSKHRPLFC